MRNDHQPIPNDPRGYNRPPHHPAGHRPHPPHHGHHPKHHKPHHGHGHIPKHVRSSMIRIQYDDLAMDKIANVYGEMADFAIDTIERCPPEIKLTLALVLGLRVDFNDYRAYVREPAPRFPSPLLNETALDAFGQALGHNDVDVATQIYDACPPEQTLLAIAVAMLQTPTEGE